LILRSGTGCGPEHPAAKTTTKYRRTYHSHEPQRMLPRSSSARTYPLPTVHVSSQRECAVLARHG
jgi:hypothetical protein